MAILSGEILWLLLHTMARAGEMGRDDQELQGGGPNTA